MATPPPVKNCNKQAKAETPVGRIVSRGGGPVAELWPMKSESKKWALMKQNVCHLLVPKPLKTAEPKLRLEKGVS